MASKTIILEVSENLKKRIEAYKKAKEITQSEAVRRLIKKSLEEFEKENNINVDI